MYDEVETDNFLYSQKFYQEPINEINKENLSVIDHDYLVPGFDFLRMMKDHHNLFTMFGLFGAIAVYLGNITKNDVQSTFNPSSVSSNYNFTGMNSEIFVNNPISVINVIGINVPSGTMLMNIGIVLSLTIFIIIGVSIYWIYKSKYNTNNVHVFDSITLMAFIFLILIVITYVLFDLLSSQLVKFVLPIYLSIFMAWICIVSRGFDHLKNKSFNENISVYYGVLGLFISYTLLILFIFFLFAPHMDNNMLFNCLFASWILLSLIGIYCIINLINKQFRTNLFNVRYSTTVESNLGQFPFLISSFMVIFVIFLENITNLYIIIGLYLLYPSLYYILKHKKLLSLM